MIEISITLLFGFIKLCIYERFCEYKSILCPLLNIALKSNLDQWISFSLETHASFAFDSFMILNRIINSAKNCRRPNSGQKPNTHQTTRLRATSFLSSLVCGTMSSAWFDPIITHVVAGHGFLAFMIHFRQRRAAGHARSTINLLVHPPHPSHKLPEAESRLSGARYSI